MTNRHCLPALLWKNTGMLHSISTRAPMYHLSLKRLLKPRGEFLASAPTGRGGRLERRAARPPACRTQRVNKDAPMTSRSRVTAAVMRSKRVRRIWAPLQS
ncbi:hypothetical protein B5K06_20965 [Rhizobium grahamii]|uniref:Uncharacterized protein n=1 Tax=Rhizobium grahamii TaxID=1120045 RepID=A0A370KLL4_9HYPH|nr:hypothetical protein B5K06_20965 [Rhizobium grahamii]